MNEASLDDQLEVGPIRAGEVAHGTQFTRAMLARGVGVHSVCIRTGIQGKYFSSGLALRVQEQMRSLVVNGVRPNRGVLAAVPALWEDAKEAAFKEDIAQRVNDAIAAAEKEAPPEDETLVTDVYARVTAQQEEQLAEVLALEGRGVNTGAFPL